MGNLDFNAADYAPQSFEPIPAGWYPATIVGSEMKSTKDGRGKYLELRIQIMEGAHKGRVVFDRLNLENQNTQAVEIARGTLSTICRAVGRMHVRDSSELHDRGLSVKVAVREYQGNLQNEVKGYRALANDSGNSKSNGNEESTNSREGRRRFVPQRVKEQAAAETAAAAGQPKPLGDYGLDDDENETIE